MKKKGGTEEEEETKEEKEKRIREQEKREQEKDKKDKENQSKIEDLQKKLQDKVNRDSFWNADDTQKIIKLANDFNTLDSNAHDSEINELCKKIDEKNVDSLTEGSIKDYKNFLGVLFKESQYDNLKNEAEAALKRIKDKEAKKIKMIEKISKIIKKIIALAPKLRKKK